MGKVQSDIMLCKFYHSLASTSLLAVYHQFYHNSLCDPFRRLNNLYHSTKVLQLLSLTLKKKCEVLTMACKAWCDRTTG